MKFLLLAVIAFVGYVGANCGCLKCSKHLVVLGEIPGGQGLPNIKVITNCDGYPNCGIGPVQPISIQKPVPQPEPTGTCGGSKYPIQLKPFFKSFCDQGCYLGTGAIRGPGAAGNPCAPRNVYDYSDYLTATLPVKVQVPVIVPKEEAKCVTLQGLKTSMDRIVIPRPALPATGIFPNDVYVTEGTKYSDYLQSGGLLGDFHGGCHSGCNTGCHGGFHGGCYDSCSPCENRYDKKNSRYKRDLLQNGYKFMVNMLPNFIQEPLKETVNRMALSHPDKKLRKIYNLPPPPLTLKEKIELKHKENVAAFRNKLFGGSNKTPTLDLTKKYIPERVIEKETDHFLESLKVPNKKSYAKPRSNNLWINEESSAEAFYKPQKSMTQKQKAAFLDKLQKLNNQGQRYRRDLNEVNKDENKLNDKKRRYKDSSFKENHSFKPIKSEENTLALNEIKQIKKFDSSTVNKENYRKKDYYKEKLKNYENKLKTTNGSKNSNSKSPSDNKTRRVYTDPQSTAIKRNDTKIVTNEEKATGEDCNKKTAKNKVKTIEEYIFGIIKNEVENLDKPKDDQELNTLNNVVIRNNILNFFKKQFQNLKNSKPTKNNRSRRSIIISSDELDLPLYQIKIQDSDEDNEIEDYEDYSEETVEGYQPTHLDEEMIRKAIKEELEKFKKVDSEEDEDDYLIGYKKSHPYQENETKFPLLRILTFPVKFFKGLKNNEAYPIVGNLPKILIGTKKYFRDFGKNLKKNVLHFTSDMIGDFDQYGPSGNVLDNIIHPNRFKRDVNITESSQQTPKSRRKRYIIKMVDDDEIEELLREKLGKLFEGKKKKYTPKKMRNILKSTPKEDSNKKVVLEPVKPKVIIDNNGLPFMEVNGYKRPLFLKKSDTETPPESSKEYDYYDSSEEANLETLNNVINSVKNRQNLPEKQPIHTLKDKISQLLHNIDILVHMNFEKYDNIYDELIEIQHVKTSIVQSWKRLIMDKKINNYDAKIDLLEKFTYLQQLKNKAMKCIVYVMQEEQDNTFALKKVTKALFGLHKIQCVIDQVVACFQEKLKTGTKFDIHKEIEFVDYLSTLRFVNAKTRNDMINNLKDYRDEELQENIDLVEKLKKLLVEDDEKLIEEEANILWEMQHIQKLQLSIIHEMYERIQDGLKIRKNLKALFDLAKRFQTLEEKEKKICSTIKLSSEEEDTTEDYSRENKKIKKIDIEAFKSKWQDKIHQQKQFMEEYLRKRNLKIKRFKKKLDFNEISDEDD